MLNLGSPRDDCRPLRRRLKAEAAEPVPAACSPQQPPQRWGLTLVAVLISLLVTPLAGSLTASAVRAEPLVPPVALQCRLDGGPWLDCLMRIESLGERWSLVVGSERVWFEHDGRGQVRMRRGSQAWIPVEPHWTADTALCWDGICAMGEIPLD